MIISLHPGVTCSKLARIKLKLSRYMLHTSSYLYCEMLQLPMQKQSHSL